MLRFVCATAKSDVCIFGQAIVLNVSDAAVAAVDDAREMARLPRFVDALQFSYMDFGKWSEFLVNKWDLTADDLPAVMVLRPESQEYAVLATGAPVRCPRASPTVHLSLRCVLHCAGVAWCPQGHRRQVSHAVHCSVVTACEVVSSRPLLLRVTWLRGHTGENAVRHEALGTYGLKTDVIIERLDAVVANNVTWSGTVTALHGLSNTQPYRPMQYPV
eukprot:m.1111069 g.1111069  ORF g.1111069 m.1111069 type:complete len:217 (-) comp24361_c0_seq17:2761-3411(-)